MINLGESHIFLDDFTKIVFDGEPISLDKKALNRVEESFNFLKEFAKDKVIYGINTGFGPMAQTRILEQDQLDLQFNLIRSHSSGCGNTLSSLECKALLLARLTSLIQGNSGVHTNLVERITDWLNHDISPLVFEHGGVGASGDLVQLAHVALSLIGEGEVIMDGERKPAKEVLAEKNILPAKIHLREGLAMINGTSVMTGIGLVNLVNAKRLLNWGLAASILCNEIVESYDDHYSIQLNRVKRHPGQMWVAEQMNELMNDSKLIQTRGEELYNKKLNGTTFSKKVQEYYSLRCIPQVLGPVFDTLNNCEEVLLNEINSSSDNPIIDLEEQYVYHGGNFHGDYVSLEMDKMKIAVTKMSMLAERQLNFLCNAKLNNKLPPFVNLGKLGLNFGVQGMQFTATSTVAENQTLSNPMYVHSIPNNNDNQDIVSMGTNAAVMTRKVIENSFEVMSIEFIAIIQAVEYLKIQDKLSSFSKGIYDELRSLVPAFVEDSPQYQKIQTVKEHLQGKKLNIPQPEKVTINK